MHHLVKLAAIIAFSLTCSAAQTTEAPKDRAPRFADYPVTQISNERVKRP